jgi:hypothetical protein
MVKLKQFPDRYGPLVQEIQALRQLIEENAPAIAIGRATAPLYLDRISQILTLSDHFNATFGLDFLTSNLTAEENLPRICTTIRLAGDLNTLLLGQSGGFLKCFGGASVIGLQSLAEWAVGNPDRQKYLLDFLAESVRRARRSRAAKKL